MITIFHFLFLIGLIAGVIVGASSGWHRFGVLGVIPGVVVGVLAGGIIGWLPGYLAILIPSLRYEFMSTVELKKQLHESGSLINFILVELRRRGEDVNTELPFVQNFLTSSQMFERTAGWAAFISAYPELIPQIPNYNPTDSTEICRKNCEPLKELVPPPCPTI